MVTASYEYKWDGDTLVVRYKKRSRYIIAQLGNAKLVINRRTMPKKYVRAVTGKANVRKGILPNSLSKLSGRWAFMPQSVKIIKKKFKDDYGNEYDLTIPEFDKNNSFIASSPTYNFDGGVVMNENLVVKLFS